MSGESQYHVWARIEAARQTGARTAIDQATKDMVADSGPEVTLKAKWPDVKKPVVDKKGEWAVVTAAKGEPITAFEPTWFGQQAAARLVVARLTADPNRKSLGEPHNDPTRFAIRILSEHIYKQPSLSFEPHFVEVGTIAALGGKLSMDGPSFSVGSGTERCRINWPPKEMPAELVEYRKTFEKAFAAEFERIEKEEFEKFRDDISTLQDVYVMSALLHRNREVAELIKIMIRRPDLAEQFKLDGLDKEKRRAAWNEVIPVGSYGVHFPDK